MKPAEIQPTPFKTAKAFGFWLRKHHTSSPGVWVQFYKKDSGIETITYSGALDEALCYGWIDSQIKKFDAKSYIQKFSPRRPKSIWSKKNRLHVVRLIKAGRMAPAGLAQVKSAKKDGRWEGAYDSSKNMVVPADLLKALAKDKKSLLFFKSLTKANVYAITWRLQTAKTPATRQKRMATILKMLEQNQKFH